ncbi:MAG: AmmeMemoRadiSam system protein B [Syntrophaceae bacterium]|nr:AmmeMemoRadiSam system protein B [Syntrophaceae bacterium]
MTNFDIREPVVAGKFYSENAVRLRLSIEKFLQEAEEVRGSTNPVAMIVPHAGYIYSGQICADGFRQTANSIYDIVVILGTNHTSPNFPKISLYPGDGFRTPLGTAMIEKEVVAALLKEAPDECVADKSLHMHEHSVEVMVPFVQVVFPDAKIIPAVVGSADLRIVERFGQALAKVLKNRKALIVASSDLSHYPSAEDAAMVDRETLEAMSSMDSDAFRTILQAHRKRGIPRLSTSACGEAPVLVAMSAARLLGATGGTVVSYANSGDVPIGDRARVVGYGAVIFSKEPPKNIIKTKQYNGFATSVPLAQSDKKALLAFARETLSRVFTTDTVPLPRNFSAALEQPRGVFVTLKKKGELRGCIGRMIGDEPLGKLVGAMAIQSAFHDRRFQQLSAAEMKEVEIEISVLTPMKPVAGAEDIVVGRDGVLLSKDGRSAVFLPQVATEQGWSLEEMLDHLCRKAGLAAGSWKKGAQFSTFQAEVFSESQIH